MVLALVELPAHLPLVIGAQQARLVVAEVAFAVARANFDRAELLRSAARDAGHASNRLAIGRCRCSAESWGENEPTDTHIPHGVGDEVCVRWPKVMAGIEAC